MHLQIVFSLPKLPLGFDSFLAKTLSTHGPSHMFISQKFMSTCQSQAIILAHQVMSQDNVQIYICQIKFIIPTC
jgi:hypothetical protein